MRSILSASRRRGRGWRPSALALALLLAAGCASESGSTTDAAIDQPALVDTAVDDIGSTHDAGMDVSSLDIPVIDARITDRPLAEIPRTDVLGIDSTVPRCVPGMSVACACVGGLSGAQNCTAEGVYGACVCPDASAPTDAAADAWTLDVPVRPLGPRLITPQSISRTTTQRPTFRWVLPEGVTRARVTVARNRALTMDVRTGTATGTSWRPTEPLPFAVWFWRVEGFGEDGGVVWTSPTWEFRAPRRDTAVDSSWGTWRDLNGDGYDDLLLYGVDKYCAGSGSGVRADCVNLVTPREDAEGYVWHTTSVRVSDLNGDGVSDAVFMAYGDRPIHGDYQYYTRLYVYWGRIGGIHGEPDLIISDYTDPISEFYQQPLVGDVNGDGLGDVIVPVSCRGSSFCVPRSSPGLRVYGGSGDGLRSLDFIPMDLAPTAGIYLFDSGDIDQDGSRDFALGTYSLGGGPMPQLLVMSVYPPRILYSVASPEDLSSVMNMDVDGDGGLDWGRGFSERIDVYNWQFRSIATTTWPFLTTAPDGPSGIARNVFGSRLSPGDVNGDGHADLVVGAPEAPLSSSSVNPRGQGTVYAFVGGPTGFSSSVASARWRGRVLKSSGDRDAFGQSISAGTDFDGDGFDDIAIAARGSQRVEVRYGDAASDRLGLRSSSVEGFSALIDDFGVAQ